MQRTDQVKPEVPINFKGKSIDRLSENLGKGFGKSSGWRSAKDRETKNLRQREGMWIFLKKYRKKKNGKKKEKGASIRLFF